MVNPLVKDELNMDQLSDRDLMTKVASSDKAAMKIIYHRYSSAIFHFARNWLSDIHEASDVMHETMLEIWKKADRFEGRSAFRSWAFSIARNKSIDKNRKNSRLVNQDADIEIPDETPDAETVLVASQDGAALRECVNKLSEVHRNVIHLAFFQSLSYKEIAEIENCPVGTVKTRILHAKKILMHCVTNTLKD